MRLELADIAAALAPFGLLLRGAFHPVAADCVPDVVVGLARTLVLIGNAGPSMWPAFSASPEGRGPRDPLDAWSRRVIAGLAVDLGGSALFPFGGPPHHPFQRWARKALAVHPSPLGVLIDPEHGLWHAFRGALVFGDELQLERRADRPSPCVTCAGKPCLSTCPVDAIAPSGYDVERCRGHVRSAAGEACRTGGCLARRSCPIGTVSTYGAEQQRFHMQAFIR